MLTFNPISRESDQTTYDSLSQSISALVQTDKNDFALRLFQVTEESEYQSFIVFDKLVKLAPIIDALGSYLRYQGLHNINILSPGDHYILPLQSGFRWMNEKVKPVVARREMSLDVALDFFCSEVMKGHVDDELFLEALLAANEALASSGAKQSARLFAISGGADLEEKQEIGESESEGEALDLISPQEVEPETTRAAGEVLGEDSGEESGVESVEDSPAIQSPAGVRTVGYLSRLFSLDPLDEINTLPAILDDDLDSGIIYEDRNSDSEPELIADNVVEVNFFRGDSSASARQAEIMELLQAPAVREFLDEQAVQQEELVAHELQAVEDEEILLQEEPLEDESIEQESIEEESSQVVSAETLSEQEVASNQEPSSEVESASALPLILDQEEAVVCPGKFEEAQAEAEDIFTELASAESLDAFEETLDDQFRVVGLDSGDDEPGAALYEQLHFPFAQGLVEPQVYKEKVDRKSAG
ncbi:MAG: hypothetical protein J0M35_08690 [Candidatus Obscuribacter phosphatis]|uniref:Uncharacterized protein n=1 Tax=Candidatus Obscuribacter phosphatis TaxID=1906157 RepID=A0A8J7PHL8_9BACT|nr:hypothetical protein [Candidatus Obscuribacter phosphatis]